LTIRPVCATSILGLCTLTAILAQPTALGNLDKASIADDESDAQGETQLAYDVLTMHNFGVRRHEVEQCLIKDWRSQPHEVDG
jgi:hypothetical protein